MHKACSIDSFPSCVWKNCTGLHRVLTSYVPTSVLNLLQPDYLASLEHWELKVLMLSIQIKPPKQCFNNLTSDHTSVPMKQHQIRADITLWIFYFFLTCSSSFLSIFVLVIFAVITQSAEAQFLVKIYSKYTGFWYRISIMTSLIQQQKKLAANTYWPKYNPNVIFFCVVITGYSWKKTLSFFYPVSIYVEDSCLWCWKMIID